MKRQKTRTFKKLKTNCTVGAQITLSSFWSIDEAIILTQTNDATPFMAELEFCSAGTPIKPEIYPITGLCEKFWVGGFINNTKNLHTKTQNHRFFQKPENFSSYKL